MNAKTKPKTTATAGPQTTGGAPIASLNPYHKNPRRGQTNLIGESLKTLGQYRPIVVNRGTHTGRPNEVLAGNHTMAAAEQIGWETIDVNWVDVDETTATKIVLIDNRANDLATNDDTVLQELLAALPDLDATGYTDDDLEALEAEDEPAPDVDPDDAPPAPSKPTSRTGDVWIMGRHLLAVGDATDPQVIESISDRPADMLWTDPPYGVDYVGKTEQQLTLEGDTAGSLGKLLTEVFTAASPHLRPGAPFYVCHADAERPTFDAAIKAAGLIHRQYLVWVKDSMTLSHADYHYRHEPVNYGTTPDQPDQPDPAEPRDDGFDADQPYQENHDRLVYGFNPGGTGRLGRGSSRWYGGHASTTVFEIPRPKASRLHPTMKPIQLIDPMIRNSCRPGGTILDPFGGSGSTLIAAHLAGRRARLIEIDPQYADVICRRYQEVTGQQPVNQATGQPHDFTPQDTDE